MTRGPPLPGQSHWKNRFGKSDRLRLAARPDGEPPRRQITPAREGSGGRAVRALGGAQQLSLQGGEIWASALCVRRRMPAPRAEGSDLSAATASSRDASNKGFNAEIAARPRRPRRKRILTLRTEPNRTPRGAPYRPSPPWPPCSRCFSVLKRLAYFLSAASIRYLFILLR